MSTESGLQMGIMEHLAELRTRLFRVAGYLCAGTLVGWFCYKFVYKLTSAPIMNYLHQHGSKAIFTGITDAFMLEMQASFIIGIIITMPLLTMELWGFISPGLTRKERHGIILVAPLSVILFALGVAVAYWVLPLGISWLADQVPPDVILMPDAKKSLLFVFQLCLAFGVVFQLPVVLMFLGKVGIVNSRMMKTYWRHSIVIITIVAAVITPSNDAPTMLAMCVPMILLYILSIGLVKIVEKSK